jgi:hypothetical protein
LPPLIGSLATRVDAILLEAKGLKMKLVLFSAGLGTHFSEHSDTTPKSRFDLRLRASPLHLLHNCAQYEHKEFKGGRDIQLHGTCSDELAVDRLQAHRGCRGMVW